ncbi:MAG: phosphonoacetaldehyde reductase [Victivallales bacterium]|nr:phosphonoacetaldehyde reductase [Victivallales bacterium]
MPQTILEGTSDLSTLLSDRRYMLVCGNSFRHQPLYTQLASNAAVVFGGFSPNPLYEQVLDGIHIFNGNHCDAIVAAGGGSALDVAKCIKLYCHTVALHDEAQALSNTPSEFNFLLQEKSDTGIPLFAIPTTAGTGSESTRHAVIYYQGVKQSISHPSIVPDVAILEPSLLKSLPLYQKKCTMMDALCQAIESTWSVNSTDESKGFARQAITLIRDNWQDYIIKQSDQAAALMLKAANLSGRAINITATTAPHAMSYKLSALHQLPHGHAVAVCLPEVWEYMLAHLDDCADTRGSTYLSDTLASLAVSLSWYRNLMVQLGLASPVATDKAQELPTLVASVNPERLKNNPVKLSKEILTTLYERILH